MISTLFIFLVVLAKIQDNEAISTKPYRFRVDNAKNRKNREELAHIIKYINDADTEIEQNKELEIGADAGNYNLEDLMKLAQNNYDTKIEYDLKKPEPSVRVHVIKNPEILQEYVKSLRRRHSTSSESSDSDSAFDRMQRRNADYENIKDQLNESLENTKKKTFVKGNIDFKIKDGQFKHGSSIKNSEKYDDDQIQVETLTKQKKKKSDTVEDIWASIKKNDFNDDVKDDIDKFKTTRRDFQMKKNTYKDYDSPSQKERKKDTVMNKMRKNSWENEDNSWKKTTKRTERWRVENNKKGYDSFESKTKKKKITHDYAPPKNNKQYDDDNNWIRNKHSKSTTSSWDKLTTLWVNTVRKKQRASYVKPSYNPGNSDYHKIGRYGGGSSFLGRTPIPFVGKKGIYEDTK